MIISYRSGYKLEEVIMVYFRYYTGTHLEVLWETTKKFSVNALVCQT